MSLGVVDDLTTVALALGIAHVVLINPSALMLSRPNLPADFSAVPLVVRIQHNADDFTSLGMNLHLAAIGK